MAIRIHETLPTLRKARGITQEELAQALGVSNQAVSKWENQQCCPDIELLPDIAEYFDITINELLCGTVKHHPLRFESECETDALLAEKALSIAGEHGKLHTSLLQRKLHIGYGKAHNILEKMEREGLFQKHEQETFRYYLPVSSQCPGEEAAENTTGSETPS